MTHDGYFQMPTYRSVLIVNSNLGTDLSCQDTSKPGFSFQLSPTNSEEILQIVLGFHNLAPGIDHVSAPALTTVVSTLIHCPS